VPGVLEPADQPPVDVPPEAQPGFSDASAAEVAPAGSAGRVPRRAPSRGVQVLGYVALGLGLGALTGVLWWQVVDLPGYRVNPDGGAATSERGLAQFIGGDAWFTLLGALVGLLLGWLGWVRLRLLGWPLVLVVAATATGAALLCWLVGYQLGPDNFNRRLVDARPGDLVLIQLTLRAKASLLVWPFAATVPVLLGSSLGTDDEEPRPRSHEPLSGPPVFGRPFLSSRVQRRSSPPPQQ
jgi:hypothetical protein